MRTGDLVVQIKSDVITGVGSYGTISYVSKPNAGYVDVEFQGINWTKEKRLNGSNYGCKVKDLVLMKNCPKLLKVLWGIP